MASLRDRELNGMIRNGGKPPEKISDMVLSAKPDMDDTEYLFRTIIHIWYLFVWLYCPSHAYFSIYLAVAVFALMAAGMKQFIICRGFAEMKISRLPPRSPSP